MNRIETPKIIFYCNGLSKRQNQFSLYILFYLLTDLIKKKM